MRWPLRRRYEYREWNDPVDARLGRSEKVRRFWTYKAAYLCWKITRKAASDLIVGSEGDRCRSWIEFFEGQEAAITDLRTGRVEQYRIFPFSESLAPYGVREAAA